MKIYQLHSIIKIENLSSIANAISSPSFQYKAVYDNVFDRTELFVSKEAAEKKLQRYKDAAEILGQALIGTITEKEVNE